jgi:hypothetical protein
MIVRCVMLMGHIIAWIVIVQRVNVQKYSGKCPRWRRQSQPDGRHYGKHRAHSPHERNVAKPFDSTRQQHRDPCKAHV